MYECSLKLVNTKKIAFHGPSRKAMNYNAEEGAHGVRWTPELRGPRGTPQCPEIEPSGSTERFCAT